MNNEVKRLPETDPKSYGPKKPEIIDMAKNSKLFENKIILEQGKIITDFKIFDFPNCRFIGVGKRVGGESGAEPHDIWDKVLSDGTKERLNDLPGRIVSENDLGGLMYDYDSETDTFMLIVGVFAEAGTDVPEGYTYRDVPACCMGVGRHISYNDAMEDGAHERTVQAMKKAGYSPDYSLGLSAEYYPGKEYGDVEPGGLYTFCYLLPCKKV